MLLNDTARLDELGWNQWVADRFPAPQTTGVVPGRVIADHGPLKIVHTNTAELTAQPARALRTGEGSPTVGDWVGVAPDAVITFVAERRTAIRRRAAGQENTEQVLAANVDVAFVVAALDGDLKPRRTERYLAVALASGARPAVLLTKSDLSPRADRQADETRRIAAGAPVVRLSCVTGEGIDEVNRLVRPGETAVLLGASGVGKSTLVNRLAGAERMATRDIRRDGKGRHTTTHRELLVLPSGGIVIDTPGLRELQLWSGEDDGVDRLFADVDAVAARCRFANCRHRDEPGCAVRDAVGRGELAPGRLRSYVKLRQEAAAVGRSVVRRRAHQAATGRRRRIAAMREEELTD